MPEVLKMPELQGAFWAVRTLESATLPEVLSHARAHLRNAQGIAYTTSKAYSVTGLGEDAALLTLDDGQQRRVPLETVYELRLWTAVPAEQSDSDSTTAERVLAHEIRWVNGCGSAEVRVFHPDGARAEGSKECLVLHNQYLQHGATLPSQKPQVMTCIEVFAEEPVYGNTVFTDELFTGRWGNNGRV
ncbi:hypothetical protein [Actinomyces ruminis]|uniref:CYTH domain-containing protein n=1 Tax=Actinomyces ruminis TaxID=1937003 RepID=A0ABX4MC06_9ACTO|nr:hypothetical protein [Actinomyces ruminis]PHP52861.1 hypothetical protein BW737_006185 [Actinomyces ruminis]